MAARLRQLAVLTLLAGAMFAAGLAEARFRPAPPYAYGDTAGRERGWHDPRRDGRSGARYRCDRGDGGTIIGAIAGGLLGNTIAGRGDRTVGTIAGAGVGALAGRAIDRNC